MKLNYEIINYPSNLPIKLFVNRIGHVELHWHQAIEICVILSGSCHINVLEESYELYTGDLILVNSNTPHQLEGSNALLATLQIRLDKLERVRDDVKKKKFDCNSKTIKDQALLVPIKTIIARLLKYNKFKSSEIDLLNISLIYELVFELINNFITNDEKSDESSLNRLTSILSFINREFMNPISLQTLAENEFLSTAYLSRYFKENVGTNFSDYLKKIRLSKAVEALEYDDASIDEIAANVGFPNTRAFVSAFKEKYAILPSLYRKNNRNSDYQIDQYNKDRSINYLSSSIEAYDLNQTNFIEKYASNAIYPNKINESNIEKTNILIDNNKDSKKLRHTWKNMIGMSRCHDILNEEVQEQIKIMQKEIHFKEIKLHSVFDDDMMVYYEINGVSYYNFNLIDLVYDFLFSVDLNPLVQLSFTPSLLASKKNKTIFLGKTNTSMPDIGKWQKLVYAFINHLILRYGLEKVLTLKFTVWNEPSSSNELFGLSNEEYQTLYQETYKTIKKINHDIKFGGPAALSCYGKSEKWLFDFLEFTKNNNIVPDFITIHYYDIDLSWLDEPFPDPNNKGKVFLSTLPNSLNLFISRIFSKFDSLGLKKEIFLTEWNNTVKHNDLVSDTIYKSAYITKSILENYDLLDSMGYWLISDLHTENQLPPYLFHGGLGLFTYNGLKKPSYYAFVLLAKLKSNMVSSGNGYFITKDANGYAIMLYNYVHYDNFYAKNDAISVSYKKRYTVFDMTKKKQFDITINDIGEFQVASYFVNREHGSVFDTVMNMGDGCESSIDKNYINGISMYGLLYKNVTASDKLQLSFLLDPLEIRLVTIIKKNKTS